MGTFWNRLNRREPGNGEELRERPGIREGPGAERRLGTAVTSGNRGNVRNMEPVDQYGIYQLLKQLPKNVLAVFFDRYARVCTHSYQYEELGPQACCILALITVSPSFAVFN